jgi:hypothetical protein
MGMTWKEYWKMTKWEWFIEGFRNIEYIIDCRATMNHFGYDDFWESLSWGWMTEYIFPYDDCYNPTISKERQLRLGQKPPQRKIQLVIDVSNSFVAYDDNGFTMCSQPDREKADKCLGYYKSKYPDAIFYGTWDT